MSDVQQGGAVSVRTDRDAPLFLVVTARDDPEHWVLPKSEVAEGEGPEDAAVRELEACGVQGAFSGRIGGYSFDTGGREVEVTYYLIHHVSDIESTTGRERAWLPYEEARERLTFEDARELLEKAAGYLTAR